VAARVLASTNPLLVATWPIYTYVPPQSFVKKNFFSESCVSLEIKLIRAKKCVYKSYEIRMVLNGH
jgi:hypothetical protein